MNLIRRVTAYLGTLIDDVSLSAATLNTAPEPVFVLQGDDPMSSALVREWCDRADRAGVNAPKVLGALEIANRMDHLDAGASFTLRAQDRLALSILRLWIQRATARGVARELITRAEAVAEAMAAWPTTKLPD